MKLNILLPLFTFALAVPTVSTASSISSSGGYNGQCKLDKAALQEQVTDSLVSQFMQPEFRNNLRESVVKDEFGRFEEADRKQVLDALDQVDELLNPKALIKRAKDTFEDHLDEGLRKGVEAAIKTIGYPVRFSVWLVTAPFKALGHGFVYCLLGDKLYASW
jgi:hypothetical protein